MSFSSRSTRLGLAKASSGLGRGFASAILWRLILFVQFFVDSGRGWRNVVRIASSVPFLVHPLLLGLVPFVQLLLQQSHILCVALDLRVGQVTNERYQSDGKVDCDPHQHLHLDVVRKVAFAAQSEHAERHEQVDYVPDFGDQADDAGPPKAYAHEIEEGHVELVGALAGFGEDFAVSFGVVGWNELLLLLHHASGIWSVFEERILCSSRGLLLVLFKLTVEEFLCDKRGCHSAEMGVRGRSLGGRVAGRKGSSLIEKMKDVLELKFKFGAEDIY
jgi:hypothetical protein